MSIILELLAALWLVLPAYAANGLVILVNGRHPVDHGLKLKDGHRLLGDGKTWEGLAFGTAIGLATAFLQILLQPYVAGLLPSALQPTLAFGLVLGFAAILGDMAGAFIKRRMKMPRGHPAPLLDQLDFLVVSLLAASLFVAVRTEWIVMLFVITPVLHLGTNIGAYFLRLKKVPY